MYGINNVLYLKLSLCQANHVKRDTSVDVALMNFTVKLCRLITEGRHFYSHL